MKFIVCYFVKKKIGTLEKAREYVDDISRYIYEVDNFYFYNSSSGEQTMFLEYLKRFENVEYANITSCGEVDRYKMALTKAAKENADFVVVLEPGHYYEEGAFTKLKRTLIEWNDGPLPSVLSPIPLLTNEEFRQEKFEYRSILGCHFLGVAINVRNYQQSMGFNSEYYQTTFDYEYCIEERLKGNKIYLLNNCLFKTREYLMLQKKKLFIFNYILYNKTVEELYYETRNRHYLWAKYRKLDPEYVKFDKSIYRREIKMMKLVDPEYSDKKYIMTEAINDFKANIKGQKFEEIKY